MGEVIYLDRVREQRKLEEYLEWVFNEEFPLIDFRRLDSIESRKYDE